MWIQKIIAGLLSFYLNALALLAPKLAGKHAFYIFCYPFSVKLKAHQEAFLDTARIGRFHTEGVDVATYTWGHGPQKLLMIHGWSSSAFRWKKFVETLDHETYTLIAFDAPGHGRSEGRILNVPIYARVIRDLVAHLDGVDHILTHSIGGFAALYACSEYDLPQPKRMALLAAPGNAEEFFDYYLAYMKISKRLERYLRDFFVSYVGHEVSYFELKRFATVMRCPALIIHDRTDKDTSYTHSERLHGVWTGSELIITDGFGHKLRDMSVVERVRGFFDRKTL